MLPITYIFNCSSWYKLIIIESSGTSRTELFLHTYVLKEDTSCYSMEIVEEIHLVSSKLLLILIFVYLFFSLYNLKTYFTEWAKWQKRYFTREETGFIAVIRITIEQNLNTFSNLWRFEWDKRLYGEKWCF